MKVMEAGIDNSINWELVDTFESRGLTFTEARIVAFIATNPGRVKCLDILGHLWPNPNREPGDPIGAIRQHISGIRRKSKFTGIWIPGTISSKRKNFHGRGRYSVILKLKTEKLI